VLDKFLQILEDGRLTDGLGRTAYFSQCLIIFTSNLGAADLYERIGKGDVPSTPQVAAHFENAVRTHFTRKIGRPELLGRIGNGVLAFDLLREPHVRGITEKFLGQLTASAERAGDSTLPGYGVGGGARCRAICASRPHSPWAAVTSGPSWIGGCANRSSMRSTAQDGVRVRTTSRSTGRGSRTCGMGPTDEQADQSRRGHRLRHLRHRLRVDRARRVRGARSP